MNTHPLRLIRISLLLAGILGWLSGCKNEPEPVTLDEPPRILSMRIPGIPQENITIDHQAHIITVVLPTNAPSLEMVPSFTVSQQTKIYGDWATGKKNISLRGYCPCGLNPYVYQDMYQQLFRPIDPIRLDNLTHTSYYTIKLKSMGPLRLKPLESPVVYDSKSMDYRISFPVENYYGSSNGFVRYIALTKTGVSPPNWIGEACFNTCDDRLNELGISLSGYRYGGIEGVPVSFFLKPGLYDLDLWLVDGTVLHATGAVLVK